jgi:type I restriction enzyme, S subunit
MSKRLIDVCTPHVSNLRMKDLLKEGPYPCFGAAGLAGYRDTFDSSVPYVGVIKDGAGVGRANVYPAKSSLLGTMESLIPSGGNDPYFLMYLLRSRNLGDSLTGSTIPHIYFKDYGKMRVPDFDRDQQRRVAVSLGLFEKSIALKNKELGEMDSLVKSRFKEELFYA